MMGNSIMVWNTFYSQEKNNNKKKTTNNKMKQVKKKKSTFVQQNVAYVFRKNIYMIILSFM